MSPEKEIQAAERELARAADRFNEASSALLHAELDFNRAIERLDVAKSRLTRPMQGVWNAKSQQS